MFEEKIKSILLEVIKNKLNGGCIYKAVDDNITYATVFDCNAVVNKLLEPVLGKLKRMGIQDIDKNNTKMIKDNISTDLKTIKKQVANGNCNNIRICGTTISLPFILTAKLQNGKIIEREFGTKENGQQYTPEEVKVILKEAQENENDGKKFKDGRPDKFTFLSMIVDMIDESIGENSKNPIRFPVPDFDNKNDFNNIKNIITNAKQDPNSPNILLIPYSANGHIGTLLVDKSKVGISETGEVLFNNGSIMCFDSSHYFTSNFKSTEKPTVSSYIRLGIKYVADHHIFTTALLTIGTIGAGVGLGIIGGPTVGIASAIAIGTTGVVGAQFIDGVCSNILTSNFNKECFSNELYNSMVKKPINDKIIQGLEGTCSFYTEAFCYLVSKYIQDNKDNKNFGLSNIEEYINSKEFIKQLKDKKEEFFNEYKATMEKVEQKQQKQKTITSKTHDITINQQTLQQTPKTPTLPIIEESPNTIQFSPHSITPSKISSTQSISSSSSSTTEHSQTPQQQTPIQSQNSQSTQSQLQQSQIISSLVNTQANNVSYNESSQQSTPPQTPISPPSNSSSLSIGSDSNY